MVSTTTFPVGLGFSLLMLLDDYIHSTLLYLADLNTLSYVSKTFKFKPINYSAGIHFVCKNLLKVSTCNT